MLKLCKSFSKTNLPKLLNSPLSGLGNKKLGLQTILFRFKFISVQFKTTHLCLPWWGNSTVWSIQPNKSGFPPKWIGSRQNKSCTVDLPSTDTAWSTNFLKSLSFGSPIIWMKYSCVIKVTKAILWSAYLLNWTVLTSHWVSFTRCLQSQLVVQINPHIIQNVFSLQMAFSSD